MMRNNPQTLSMLSSRNLINLKKMCHVDVASMCACLWAQNEQLMFARLLLDECTPPLLLGASQNQTKATRSTAPAARLTLTKPECMLGQTHIDAR